MDADGRSSLSGPGPAVFIPAIGTLGDVLPYAALANRLAKRGVRVVIAVHNRHRQVITNPEVEIVELKQDLEALLALSPAVKQAVANPSFGSAAIVKTAFYPMIKEQFDICMQQSKNVDLIIVTATASILGFSALELYPKLQLLNLHLFPTTPTAQHAPIGVGSSSTSWFNWINSIKWMIYEKMAWGMFSESINRLRADYGLPPVQKGLLQHIHDIRGENPVMLAAYSKELLPRPTDWPDTSDMIPPLFPDHETSKYNPPKELETFLDPAKPKPVYIGVGSMMYTMLEPEEQEKLLQAWIDGVRLARRVRAVISLSGMGDEKKNYQSDDTILFVSEFIPHHWLFPKIAAVAHHGGTGTMHTGLLYGLPTLIMPFGADQPFNGDRIFVNKLGPAPISARAVSGEVMANALSELVTNETFKSNAERIGNVLRSEDGLETAANAVADLLMNKRVRYPVAL